LVVSENISGGRSIGEGTARVQSCAEKALPDGHRRKTEERGAKGGSSLVQWTVSAIWGKRKGVGSNTSSQRTQRTGVRERNPGTARGRRRK